MSDESVVLVNKDGPIAVVTINRPKAFNALNSDVLEGLGKAVDDIAADDSIRAVVVTGAGDKAFVAGADIKQMVEMTPMEARTFMTKGHEVMDKLQYLEKPVIAAINGFCLGGGLELAMSCDIRYASEKAKLGLPEVGLGIHPGFGGTQRLARLVGRGKACEMVFTAAHIKADEALTIGLVQKIAPPDKLMEEVMALAKTITKQGPIAVKMAKASLNQGLATDFKTGLKYEIESVAQTFATDDLKEGMTAFIEKRKPDFKNK
jgi:enoyl-CoA hydratase